MSVRRLLIASAIASVMATSAMAEAHTPPAEIETPLAICAGVGGGAILAGLAVNPLLGGVALVLCAILVDDIQKRGL